MFPNIFKKAFELYIQKKSRGLPVIKKSLIKRYIDNTTHFNESLNLLFFDNITHEYDDNHRNGVYINNIISPSIDTDYIYYSFRGREVLTYHLKNKNIKFVKEEYNMCMFNDDDFVIMSLFLKNCLRDIQGQGVDLESYEVN